MVTPEMHYSLKEILDDHSRVLFDSSAIEGHLGQNRELSSDSYSKTLFVKEQIDFINELINYCESLDYKNKFF